MKIIMETVDNENYIEIVLDDFSLDLIDEDRVVNRSVLIGKRLYNVSVRKQTQEEKYALDQE
jgi:hypothetical protein